MYVVKASSGFDQQSQHWVLFDNRSPMDTGVSWKQDNYISGVWAGEASSRYTLDGSYYGDWVTIQMPQRIALAAMSFGMRWGSGRCPGRFKV